MTQLTFTFAEPTDVRPRRKYRRSARSLAAEAAFRARLAELGAVLLEPEWLGSSTKHRVRCVSGHECMPRPNGIKQGDGICLACVGHDPAASEARFRTILAEHGAELLEPCWLGVKFKHRIRCAKGHICDPRPNGILAGVAGICRICADRCTKKTETAFRARVEALGGECLYAAWRGVGEPHHIRCPKGHDAYPRPNSVQQGIGICLTCAGLDPVASEAKFLARLAELGAIPLYREWVGCDKPHRVQCPKGHICHPRPKCVIQGQGVCRPCACTDWDVFYVVTSDVAVKFGVTFGDPRPRLRNHAQRGYTNVAYLATGLSPGVPLNAERAVKAALADAGDVPIKGREYFDVSCLALILDIATSWTAPVAM